MNVDLRRDYAFTPLAFETLGGVGLKTADFIKKVCNRLRQVSGCHTAGKHFKQLLSLTVQRGNAASVLGTLRQPAGGPGGASRAGLLHGDV